jgi:hypothetical protein
VPLGPGRHECRAHRCVDAQPSSSRLGVLDERNANRRLGGCQHRLRVAAGKFPEAGQARGAGKSCLNAC